MRLIFPTINTFTNVTSIVNSSVVLNINMIDSDLGVYLADERWVVINEGV
ncbi:hypothetical protein [Mycoplasmopsis mucosicanis]|nr:hypothetical protein [Mycoplasmopsis mucosicanis]